LGSTAEAARAAGELLRLGCRVHWASPDGPAPHTLPDQAGLYVYQRHTVTALDGHVGGFTAALRDEFGHTRCVGASAVIVATGNGRGPAPGIDGLAASPHVLTLAQAERQMSAARLRENTLPHRRGPVALVLDLIDETGKEMATAALCLAQRLRREGHAEVYCYYRDLKVDSPGLERLTRELRADGTVFVRYAGPALSISEDDDGIIIAGPDGPTHVRLLIMPELIRPRDDAAPLAAALRVRIGADGYFQPVNVRAYRAGLASRRGVYFAGRCHMDCSPQEAEADAEAVAGAVDALLVRGYLEPEDSPAHVDAQKCIRCLTCVRSCPHAAVEIVSYDEVTAARVSELACHGCGVCAAHCPVRAIDMAGAALPAWLQGDPA
jgi:heterodisulfide reductase subunit A